jgi:hypothetical protein
MNRKQGVCLMAGTMILLSITLAHLVSPWWLLLTAFVGLNLFQSAFTGFCPAEHILARLGLPDQGVGGRKSICG